jgi:hypothetical protein
MTDSSPPHSDPAVPASPQDAQAEQALQHALAVLVPLVRWLLRSGVRYGALAAALKPLFVEVARAELAEGGAKITDSALSVMSGVHRKDVRQLAGGTQGPDAAAALSPTPVSQLFTRWVSDPRFRQADGRPRRLQRAGPAPSFESLAREVCTDVHPRTLLEELVRLGLGTLQGDEVELQADTFVPAAGQAEAAALLAANTADHLAAAVHNLTRPAPKFLEQSVFADGLSMASVEALGTLARELWKGDFERMVAEATQRVQHDESLDPLLAAMRMRFGVYYYFESMREGGADDSAKPSVGRSK